MGRATEKRSVLLLRARSSLFLGETRSYSVFRPGPTCRVGLAPQTRGVGADGKALRRFSFGCISRSLLSTSGNITQTQNTLLFSKTIKSRKPTNILCTEKLTLRRSPEEGGHLSGLSLQLFFNQQARSWGLAT